MLNASDKRQKAVGLLKTVARQTASGISAGLMITIGCCVYLGCIAFIGSDHKWVGAILFSVALLTICYKGYSLYTGRIGLMLDNLTKDGFSDLLLGLLGNVIATAVVGIAVQYAIPELRDAAYAMCFAADNAKLTQLWWKTLIRAILCGVLMYVAVSVYREKKTVVGIVFCIPVFILSGFEHSIADMGYFAIGGVYSAKAFGFIMLVILGNSIGALILPLLSKVGKELKKNERDTTEAHAPKTVGDAALQGADSSADTPRKAEARDIEAVRSDTDGTAENNMESMRALDEAGVTCEVENER